jgi:serine/threonine-protein kinase RsbW
MDEFKIDKIENGFNSSFPSTWENVERGVNEAVDFVKAAELNIDLFAFRLSLYESLSNAAKHGNKLDPSQNVIFNLEATPKRLRITIEDNGDGFDWRKALNNKNIIDYETPSGRGIMLLKAYGYSPQYNEKGNALLIEKNLE